MKLKEIILICSIFIFSQKSLATTQLFCDGDYRLAPGQCAIREPHDDVERAGVVLVKDYGEDEPGKPNSRYAVIIGHDCYGDFWNFQAGRCEPKHSNTSETAQDELSEETGGSVQYSSEEISGQPYIYWGKKQLFFVRDDNINVHEIRNACLLARNNLDLPRCKREIDDVVAISIFDFLSKASTINLKNYLYSKQYFLPLGDENINFDGYYMRMIANRLPEVRQILSSLFDDPSLLEE